MTFFRKHALSLIAGVVAAWHGQAEGAVTLPKMFSDNMVLQRGRPVAVWGRAAAGETVNVAFGGQALTSTADSAGDWQVTLAAMPANKTGQTLTVAGTNTVAVNNILVGDVWICSGQSNMALTLCVFGDFNQIKAEAVYPTIRQLRTAAVTADQPQAELSSTMAWEICDGSKYWVGDFSAVAYYFARELVRQQDVPVGLISTNWGGTRIEPWIPAEGAAAVPELRTALQGTYGSDQQMSSIYNAMVNPYTRYAIRGAIWYQGEANGGEGFLYSLSMKALITGWRAKWNQSDFPFYFVQLASYQTSDAAVPPGDGRWAYTREAQMQTLALPNTGMAVTIDIGDSANIHPDNKVDVGRRLALWALAKDYGQSVVFSGPLYRSCAVEGNKIRIRFDHAESGLMVASKTGTAPAVETVGGSVKWIAISGADGVWYWADAVIDGQTLLVSSPSVANPVAVRYAFAQNPDGAGLYNRDGLPAGPFRTDTDALNALTVTGGSGSGSYPAGARVQVTATGVTAGRVFDRWTGDTGLIASATSATTTLTMPARAAALSATYTSTALLLFVAGQSNADGAGLGYWAVPDHLKTSSSNVLIWQEIQWAPNHGFQILQNGINNNWSRSATGTDSAWGPEAEFASQFHQTFPDRKLYIVKRSLGGTNLAQTSGGSPDWSPASSGELFDLMLADANDAKATLASQGVAYDTAFMWVQGENDATTLALANAYQTNLQALFTAVRSRLGDGNTVLLCNWLDDGPYWTWYQTVRNAEQAVVAGFSRAALVETNDLPLQGDNMHFSAAGQVTLGERMFTAYLQAATGTAAAATYALTVANGTGGGSYAATTTVAIAADAASTGQTFSQWTGDTDHLASATAASTTVVMPAQAVTVTATYATTSTGGGTGGTIISDAFVWNEAAWQNGWATGYFPSLVHAPDTNLPGGTWQLDNSANDVYGIGIRWDDMLVVSHEGGSAGISLTSSGSYAKPTNLHMATELRWEGTPGDTAGTYALVGFYSALNGTTGYNTANTLSGFTGLKLSYANGSLQLIVNGTAAGSAVGYTGTWTPTSAMSLAYDISTSSGTIANVTLGGSSSSYSFSTSAFTNAATAYAGLGGYCGNSGVILMDNLAVSGGDDTSYGSTVAIRLSGDLAFGDVVLNQSGQRTLTIHNDGEADLDVASLTCPAGFTGAWSGTVASGASTDTAITFSPTSLGGYSGVVTIQSNATTGTAGIACSGAGVPVPNAAPVVDAGADQSVILPATATLAASVTDDGLPASSPVTCSWSKISGAGTVTFASTSSENTTASFSAAGTYVLRLTADDGALSGSDELQVTVTNPAPPAFSSSLINAGAAQRSMITSLTLSFTRPVNLATGAVTLTRRALGTDPAQTPTVTLTPGADRKSVSLTFPGATGGSLADGIYDLSLSASMITDDYGQPLSDGNRTITFHRLFGDHDGNKAVNNADYFRFKNAFDTSAPGAGYLPQFDYDGNGIINNADYFQFKKRFGTSLTY